MQVKETIPVHAYKLPSLYYSPFKEFFSRGGGGAGGGDNLPYLITSPSPFCTCPYFIKDSH